MTVPHPEVSECSINLDILRGRLDIIAPVFNEVELIPALLSRLEALRDSMAPATEVVVHLVDDGSRDGTGAALLGAQERFDWLDVIVLTRNFGHQSAVSAGLANARGTWACIIDGDLQDPPELIPKMLEKLVTEGHDVVYGQRIARDGETKFKRATASLFYRTLRRFSKLDIPVDTGDFRVMTRRVVDAVNGLPEHHRFLRAMIPWLGYTASPFPYSRHARTVGSTKFPLSKMVSLAGHALASFSSSPIRIAQASGLALLMMGSLGLVVAVVGMTLTSTIVGLHALAALIVLCCGLSVLVSAMVGGYVYRVQEEVKHRPLFVVDRQVSAAADAK